MNSLFHHVKVGGCCYLRLPKSQKSMQSIAEQYVVVVEARDNVFSIDISDNTKNLGVGYLQS